MRYTTTPDGDFVVLVDRPGLSAVLTFSRNESYALLSELERHLHAQPVEPEPDE